MTRAELIAALEKATGPSRELDLAICRGALNSEPLGHAAGMDDGLLLMQRVGLYPRYTSSIDAALTLVPDGMRWRVFGVPTAGKAFASCKTGSTLDPATEEWEAVAPTPALALCIAALKAQGDGA